MESTCYSEDSNWLMEGLTGLSLRNVVIALAMISLIGLRSCALAIACGADLEMLLECGEKSTILPKRGIAFLLH